MKRFALAACLVAAFAATGPATAHWLKPPGIDSVRGQPPDRRIVFQNDSTYIEARVHARDVWNELDDSSRTVTIRGVEPGETPTVIWLDVYRRVYWGGYWDYRSGEPDLILMNERHLGPPGDALGETGWGDLRDEKVIAAHEVGHALGLDHNLNNPSQLMWDYPASSEGRTIVTRPQNHDTQDYYERWN